MPEGETINALQHAQSLARTAGISPKFLSRCFPHPFDKPLLSAMACSAHSVYSACTKQLARLQEEVWAKGAQVPDTRRYANGENNPKQPWSNRATQWREQVKPSLHACHISVVQMQNILCLLITIAACPVNSRFRQRDSFQICLHAESVKAAWVLASWQGSERCHAVCGSNCRVLCCSTAYLCCHSAMAMCAAFSCVWLWLIAEAGIVAQDKWMFGRVPYAFVPG